MPLPFEITDGGKGGRIYIEGWKTVETNGNLTVYLENIDGKETAFNPPANKKVEKIVSKRIGTR